MKSSSILLQMHVKTKAKQSAEYFQLLVRLLEYVNRSGTSLPNAEALLNNEIQWLKKTRVSFIIILFIKTVMRDEHNGDNFWCRKMILKL